MVKTNTVLEMFLSGSFWVSFTFWLCVYRCCVADTAQKIRPVLFLGANLFFLWRFTPIGLLHAAGLLSALCAIYAAGLAMRTGGKPARPLFAAALSALCIGWILVKSGGLNHEIPFRFLNIVGASYLFIKLWSFLKDSYDGFLRQPSFLVFLNYCTFFPCFVSGPMHRYGEFQDAFSDPLPWRWDLNVERFYRLTFGLLKVCLIAEALRPYSLSALQASGFTEAGGLELLLRGSIYSIVLYCNFSGYSDIAISSSALLGIHVPENFNRPYVSANIREFWQRWHMTLTRFLNQYIFLPLSRSIQIRFRGLNASQMKLAAYLSAFLFAGIWHGLTPNFALWGAYHGFGLWAYDSWCLRFPGGARASLVSKIASWGVTFVFVSTGWVFFVLPLEFFAR